MRNSVSAKTQSYLHILKLHRNAAFICSGIRGSCTVHKITEILQARCNRKALRSSLPQMGRTKIGGRKPQYLLAKSLCLRLICFQNHNSKRGHNPSPSQLYRRPSLCARLQYYISMLRIAWALRKEWLGIYDCAQLCEI